MEVGVLEVEGGMSGWVGEGDFTPDMHCDPELYEEGYNRPGLRMNCHKPSFDQILAPYRPSMSLPRDSSILKSIYLSSTRVKAALILYSTGSTLTQSELIMLPVLQMLTNPEQATAR